MQPTDGHKTSRFSLMSRDLNREFRVHRVLYACSFVLVGVNTPWVAYTLVNQQWLLGGLRFLLIVTGVVVFILLRKHQARNAFIVLAVSLFIIFCIGAAIFDVPTASTPRTMHIYFLLIGICCFIGFREERYVLSYGFPLVCFVAYVFFASSQWGIHTSYALSANERVVAAWMTSIIGMSVLFVIFHVMQSNPRQSSAMENDLCQALARNQFILHYQPQADENGQIMGAEALIRWHHPIRGFISPDEFIPLAEQIGLIGSMGHWVLETACAQLVSWSQKTETALLSLSVNVSAQEFKQEDYVSQVLSVIERSGANPSLLKLELTESMLVNDVDDIISKMTQLKAAGVRISLDDFGTGYSSLTYLRKLPLDQLKVDQSFIREMLSSPQDEAIVRTVVSLAQNMELDVIAEGVESEEQRQFLESIGCASIQGYLLSRPLRIYDFNVFISRKMTQISDHVGLELQES